MKLGKLLLAVVGATVLLSALVSSASARNFSVSSQTTTALWSRWDFRGGIEETECEVRLSASFHSRTIAKSSGTLIGYITEATILGCRSLVGWQATINQASLPWHRRYGGFTGTLPRISGQAELVTGAEWTFSGPLGFTCTVRGATLTGTYTISSGTMTAAAISGTSRCDEFFLSLRGSTTDVLDRVGGSRIRMTLI